MTEEYKTYKHSPPHFFKDNQVYMITASTYKKLPLLTDDSIKLFLLDLILNKFNKYHWRIDAYVILNNHYHLLVQALSNAQSLPKIIREIHKFSAIEINRQRSRSVHKVWWNYWDTLITYEKSYYARLNYIHFNPVKHGYVEDPINYSFSSYKSFYDSDPETALSVHKIYPFDKVKIKDDF